MVTGCSRELASARPQIRRLLLLGKSLESFGQQMGCLQHSFRLVGWQVRGLLLQLRGTAFAHRYNAGHRCVTRSLFQVLSRFQKQESCGHAATDKFSGL